jgi:hypothetical protein
VIDNLFIFLNKKDWKAANSFYSDSGNNDKNATFFKRLFERKQIVELNIFSVSKNGNDITVTTNSKNKNGRNTKACFQFTIRNNRIEEQKQIDCYRK